MMQIFVKTLTDGTITVEVEEGDTVGELKWKIFVKKGTHPCDQRIIYAGKQLKDHLNMIDCGIVKHSMLHLVLRLEQKPPRKQIFNSVPSYFSDLMVCTVTKDLPTVMIDVIEEHLEMQEFNVALKLQLINLRNVIVDVLFLNQVARLSSMNFIGKVLKQKPMKVNVFCKWLCEVGKIPLFPKQANQDCSKIIEPIRNSLNKHIRICFCNENRVYSMHSIINCIVNIHKRSGEEMPIKLRSIDTVQTLKRIIWQKTNIICKQQYLTVGSKALKDNKQIMHYGKNTINLVLNEILQKPKKKGCVVM